MSWMFGVQGYLCLPTLEGGLVDIRGGNSLRQENKQLRFKSRCVTARSRLAGRLRRLAGWGMSGYIRATFWEGATRKRSCSLVRRHVWDSGT